MGTVPYNMGEIKMNKVRSCGGVTRASFSHLVSRLEGS